MSGNYYGKVTRVIDGDTFQVKDQFGNTQTIRLFGVDTPERKQPFGKEATEFTKKLIDQKTVHVQSIELGKYSRVVAIVKIQDQSLAEILLRNGIAFAAGPNHRLANTYYALEEKARVNNQGVHKFGIINPAIFRKQSQRSRNPTFGRSRTPAPTPVPRFKPDRPKPNILEKLKKFFSSLVEKNEENAQKREAIKKAELERIEKRMADRKLSDDIRQNLEKRQQDEVAKPAPIEKPVEKIDTADFVRRFKERSKNM